jgi:bifunctional UDP-N-acetylglucosamine pyrophosphorylase/glucosamine-1-phosphate N-acetyltransferase
MTHARVPFRAVVLAAGRGTRMKSALPKVLHPVLGRPMVTWPVDAALAAGASQVTVVVGHDRARVEAEVMRRYAHAPVETREQTRMQGTGDAVMAARDTFRDTGEVVLILNGDVPNLRREHMEALLEVHQQQGATLSFVTAHCPSDNAYGRVVRDGEGQVTAIVEARDATPAQRTLTEVNVGVYAVAADWLSRTLDRIEPRNAAGEYYLTDLVALGVADGVGLATWSAPSMEGLEGVNDRVQLAEANGVARDRRNRELLLSGVTLVDPATTWVEGTVVLETDVLVEPCVVLSGTTTVASGARIGSHSRLQDCRVAEGFEVAPGTIARGQEFGYGTF